MYCPTLVIVEAYLGASIEALAMGLWRSMNGVIIAYTDAGLMSFVGGLLMKAVGSLMRVGAAPLAIACT